MATTSTRSERLAAFEAAMDHLGPLERRVIELRHVAGLTIGEIAAAIGNTDKRVEFLLEMGERKLRRNFITVPTVS